MTSWILSSQAKPAARIRLFCFSSAGRGASTYGEWSRAFGPEVDVCPVQLPGRENRYREPPFTRIGDALAALRPVIEGRRAMPFAFFGHSLGAIIAFELARLLRRCGSDGPAHLFVSARRAPQIPEPWPPISHLPPGEFLDAVQDRYDGIPDAIRGAPDMLEITLPPLRADFEMFENYVYSDEAPIDCPITALGGSEDSTVFLPELEAWRRQTQSRFSLKMFPGDHFYLQRCRTGLIEAISGELKRTMGRTGQGETP